MPDSTPSSERDRLLQTERQAYIKEHALRGPWITVLQLDNNYRDRLTFFCAFVDKTRRETLLKGAGWDFSIGDGGPSVWTGYGPQGRTVRYSRYGSDGVQPLIIHRHFPGNLPNYNELSEEFRLYHELYYDEKRKCYLHFNDDGQEEVAAEITAKSARVKLWLITDFLAVKQMDFVLFFEGSYSSNQSFTELDVSSDNNVSEQRPLLRLDFHVSDKMLFETNGSKCFSRLIGKLILPCPTQTIPNSIDNPKKENFQDFIIDIDPYGKPVRNTCDPEKLADYFGINPDARHYLTLVHFRREVLQKYFDNPQSYTVSDGLVTCQGYWSLQIDNDRLDRVIVFLGDLGRYIGEAERQHWLHHNITPEGGLSLTGHERSMMGNFADPTNPELIFKRRYEEVAKLWESKEGWPIFRPLTGDDSHLLKIVRIPLSDNQAEFDNIILALAKLLVDSLNEGKLRQGLNLEPGDKGLVKLEKFLINRGRHDFALPIKFLRNLQTLRGGSAHRKRSDYDKAAAEFGMDKDGRQGAAVRILTEGIQLLNYLEICILPSG